MTTDFARRYGPWAVVAGGSEGIGAAFADELAARRCHVLLVAQGAEALEASAATLRTTHGVQVRTVELDLGRDDLVEVLAPRLDDLEIGCVVWNAAVAPRGRFDGVPPDALDAALDVNVRGPIRLLRHLVPAMVARGRGGVVLMSSLAAGQGTALLATYAATKAFTRVLAEGLWADLGPLGVDVVAVTPGATDTPAYRASGARGGPRPGPAVAVARAGLDGLGRGPVVAPRPSDRLAAQVMQRLMPRRVAVRTISRATRRMYGE